MYIKTTLYTLAAWLIGLVLDANLDWNPKGSLCLTLLLPILAMGLCVLKAIKESKSNGKHE